MSDVIGLDLGGTQLRAGLFRDGAIIARGATAADAQGGPEAIVQQMKGLINELNATSAKAVGLCMPGPLDSANGIAFELPNLKGWKNFAIRDALRKATGLPAVVENDAVAAAYGEWRKGAGQGLQNMIYLTISTGIGGGAVVDGHLLHGRYGMAAHMGHMPIAHEGRRCGCGSIGCFEAYACGPAWARLATEQLVPDSALATLSTITPADIVAAARAGDRYAKEQVARQSWFLGKGFAGLSHLFSPDIIVMGGGVSEAFDFLIPGIEAAYKAEAIEAFKDVRIVKALLAGNAGLTGAALLAEDLLQKS
jgi:glucokinase